MFQNSTQISIPPISILNLQVAQFNLLEINLLRIKRTKNLRTFHTSDVSIKIILFIHLFNFIRPMSEGLGRFGGKGKLREPTAYANPFGILHIPPTQSDISAL